jgi:hypothetical protein
MVMKTSPLFSESPGDHVRSPPNQPYGKSLTEYYVVFRDYLAMSALVRDADMSLDDPEVIDMFISGTVDYKFFKRVSREPRHQPSQAHKFRDESIVSTLEEYMTYPDYVPATLPPKPTRQWYQDSKRSFEPRALNALDMAPPEDMEVDGPPALTSANTEDSDDTKYPSEAHINALGHLIPPSSADLQLDQKYRSAVYAINQRPATSSAPCLVCGENHRFDSCPVLQNVEYLRDHYIKFCSFLKRDITSRQKMTRSLPPFLPDDSDVNAVGTLTPPGPPAYLNPSDRDQDFHWRQM